MSGAPTRLFLPLGAHRASLPCLRIGSGTPLVVLPGLTAHHRTPHGVERWLRLRQCGLLAQRREVWWINRKPGLAPDTTVKDLAHDYAEALRPRFGHPVDIVGESVGGRIALQLAADYPQMVRRLVIISAACRLGDTGAQTQREVARWLRLGRPRRAAAAMLAMRGGDARSRRLLRGLGWVLGEALCGPGDPDLLATLEAPFDLSARLGEITAPTLIVGGERDACFGRELFEETAAGIPGARVVIVARAGHLGMSSRILRHVLAFLDEAG